MTKGTPYSSPYQSPGSTLSPLTKQFTKTTYERLHMCSLQITDDSAALQQRTSHSLHVLVKGGALGADPIRESEESIVDQSTVVPKIRTSHDILLLEPHVFCCWRSVSTNFGKSLSVLSLALNPASP